MANSSGSIHTGRAYKTEDLRRRFPILDRLTYLNSCSQGALSTHVRDAYERYLRDWDQLGSPWELWVGKADEARHAFAALIGADDHEVAVTTSVSAAVSSLASALRYGARDKIVLSEVEFPTIGQIWHAQEELGARVVHTRDFEQDIDEETLLVSVTHVSYRTGERLPVEDVVRTAHERGALVLLRRSAAHSSASLPPMQSDWSAHSPRPG